MKRPVAPNRCPRQDDQLVPKTWPVPYFPKIANNSLILKDQKMDITPRMAKISDCSKDADLNVRERCSTLDVSKIIDILDKVW